MKPERIPTISKWLLALFLALAVLSCQKSEKSKNDMARQLINTAGRGGTTFGQ